MTVEKPKPKQLLQPTTTGAGNQSQFLAIICNWLKAREKSRVHGAIGFGFDSHWLKNWRESFKPITKRSNRNHVFTFDSHLKTALVIGIALKVSHQFLNQWEAKPNVSYSLQFPQIWLVHQLLYFSIIIVWPWHDYCIWCHERWFWKFTVSFRPIKKVTELNV